MKPLSLRTLVFLSCLVFFGNRPALANDTLLWTSQASGVTQDLWSVYFVDSLHGWAVGNYGAAVRTANGGALWSKCTFPSTDTLYTVVFADPAHGWTAGTHGAIYASSDSGKSWIVQFSKVRTWFSDAWRFDSQTVLFAGSTDTTVLNPYDSYAYVLRTANAGQTWTGSVLPNPAGLNSICFVDKLHGWAAGLDMVTSTSNGGQTWGSAVHPLPGASYRGYVNAIWFVDTLRGFGAGRYGGIVGTKDGGKTWNFIDTASGAWIEDICFADPLHGVAVGERGMIAVSSDSGKTWGRGYPHHLPTIDASWFRSVFFLNAQNGWAAGDQGIIIKGAFKGITDVHGLPHQAESVDALQIRYFRGSVYVDFGKSINQDCWISVFSIDGRLVYGFQVRSGVQSQKADLPLWNAGAYIIAATMGNRVLGRALFLHE
jgi:photosystem II stability/assembly factor-like uncharacterized protein